MLKERAKEVAAAVMLGDALLFCGSFFAAFLLRARLLPRWYPSLPYVHVSMFMWILFLAVPLFCVLLWFGGVYESLRTSSLPQLP